MQLTTLLARHPAAPSAFLRGLAHTEDRGAHLLVWLHPNTEDSTRAQVARTLGQVTASDWLTALHDAPHLVGPHASRAASAPVVSREQRGELLDALVANPHTPVDVAADIAHDLVVNGPITLAIGGALAAFVATYPDLGAPLAAAATNRDVGLLLAAASAPDAAQVDSLVNDLVRGSGVPSVSVTLARAGAHAHEVLLAALDRIRPALLLDIADATVAAAPVRATALLAYLTREKRIARALPTLAVTVRELAAADGIDPELITVFHKRRGGPWPADLLTGPAVTPAVFTAALAQAHRGTRVPAVLSTIACHPNAAPAQRTTAAAFATPPWATLAALGVTQPPAAELGAAVPVSGLTDLDGPLWRAALDAAAGALVPSLDSADGARVLTLLAPQFTGTLSDLVVAASAIAL